MRVLLTGCNGFIGRHIAAKLIERKYYVHGLGQKPRPQISLPGYSAVDISSKIDMERLAEELKNQIFDVLVHCAAYISYDESNSDIVRVNILGTQNLIALAKDIEIRKIVYCSSAPVIGHPITHPVTEEHPLNPTTMYHISKLTGELMVKASGLDYVNLRIPSPIGTGMNERTILPVFIKNCLANQDILIKGTGSRIQNYVSVHDIVNAVLCGINSSVNGCFNVCGDFISNLDLAKLCKNLTGSISKIKVLGDYDPNDGDIWDLSPVYARRLLGFEKQFTLESTIVELIHFFEKGC